MPLDGPPRFMPVPVHRYNLGGGCDIPMLSSMFSSDDNVHMSVTTLEIEDNTSRQGFVKLRIYYIEDSNFDHPNYGAQQLGHGQWLGEMAVFRVAFSQTRRGRLVNMRQDSSITNDAIECFSGFSKAVVMQLRLLRNSGR